MASDGRSLRRRNRWAFCGTAFILATAGTAFLQASLLRLLRERQEAALNAGERAVTAALALKSGSLGQLPDAPPGLLWAAGTSPQFARLSHPAFRDVASLLVWPLTPGASKTLRLSSGRSFRVRVADPPPELGRIQIYLALDTTQDEALAREILIQRISAAAVIVLASLAFADLIFRQAMRPLKELEQKAASIRPKELGQLLDIEHFPVELHGLASSLNITLERMQDAFQRLEHLSTDLAHELRSPIQNLRSELEGLLLHPPAERERNDTLGSALEELDRLSSMIEQMLFLARCEDPSSALRLHYLPIETLLQEIADYFEASAESVNVGLSVESEPLLLFADRSLVQRALSNLVSNALRHTPPGGRIMLRGREAGSHILLEVADTGEGIPADVLPRLGTRFTRAEGSRSRSTGGSGLGLAIVQGIMRLHAGTLELESALGKGTTARLRFRKDPARR